MINYFFLESSWENGRSEWQEVISLKTNFFTGLLLKIIKIDWFMYVHGAGQSIVRKDYRFASETKSQSIQDVSMIWWGKKKQKSLTFFF